MAAVEFTVFKGSATGDIVESRGSRTPGPTEVSVKITHCGVCGTDQHYRHADQGLGHEGVGTITELGSMVSTISDFKVGDRVLMGWFQQFCGRCKGCLTGRQNICDNSVAFGEANHDRGGFATATTWDVSALYKIPDEIDSEHAGPLVCGGATVWQALYAYGAKAGDRVGIMGVGGLGHLAIQFADKMGMEAVVLSSSETKRDEAMKFGASEFYVTSGDHADVEKLTGAGKLDYMLLTTSGVPDKSTYLPVLGSGLASSQNIKQMLRFAAKRGVRPQIETFPMNQKGVSDAMQKLRDGKMRYRGVVVVE
ncbi:alcohol dehydrogenase [Microdochium trichocladiopsis]|uniref:Alcohol dehydrogenase n=1 Tax=Microdochium trichocladiopsis TaxID=1682393 RepID=A0A9P8Y581_9PEZI|nr:alcohol dehydrogenase [Microdochium trichocladiopsis]KAH7029911.1 alcohol dehydrogenase [Microdochium trichocladiopsis]